MCLLFIFFLNTLCLPQAYASRGKFIPPLILADYDNGTLITNLGGLSGGDEESPGVAFAGLIPDDGFARGNWGYSLKLDYDVSNTGEFSFY